MAKTYRYHPPKISTNSPVPAIFGLRDYVDMMNLVVNDMPGRTERGRQLFLLALAKIVRENIQRGAPEIQSGDKQVDYARDLRIAIVDGAGDGEAVAIYFESKKNEITKETIDENVLFFKPLMGSPKFVGVLERFGPWPAKMVPFTVGKHQAVIISRRARTDEINSLADRIYDARSEIQAAFRATGMANVDIKESNAAIGVEAVEDIGFNILRKEFGYDGEQQASHWRPALKKIEEDKILLMKKYLEYLKTGRESIFDLPKEVKNITTDKLREGARFMSVLAPFVQ